MKDFWINSSGNFQLSGRDLQFTPDDVDYMVSRLTIKFRTFYGEYFLNTTEGVPYLPSTAPNGISIFGKNSNKDTISALFKAQISSEPLVDSITKFLMEFDNNKNQLAISFVVKLKSGAVVNSSVLVP